MNIPGIDTVIISLESMSSISKQGLLHHQQGSPPYEQRVFPLNDAEYIMMTRETEDCDIGPPSPPLDSTTHEAHNHEEV